MKANLIVGAHREGNYWPNPAAKEPVYNMWTWGPRYEFTVLGPLAGGSQLSVETYKPDGSPWLTYPIQTPEITADDAHRFMVPNSHDEKKLIPMTGAFSFKIMLKNELTKTNTVLYQGKFTVNKFHYGNNLPQFKNQFEYYVENDWRLPYGLLFADSQMDAEAPRLRILMWFRDTEKVLTTDDAACYVFFNGKQIASTKTNGGAISKLQVNTSGMNAGEPGWRTMVFFVNQISTGRIPASNNNYRDIHWLDKNPGVYEIKVLREGKLARTARFTVGADGKIADNGIAAKNKFGGDSMLLPIKIEPGMDGKADMNAWKQGFFYNPVAGFTPEQ